MVRISDAAADDLFESGKEARDAGIDMVLANAGAWKVKASTFVVALPSGWIGTGEDIKLAAEPLIGAPHHHNAWGGIINGHVGVILIPTGRWLHTKAKKSHYRRLPEYRRV